MLRILKTVLSRADLALFFAYLSVCSWMAFSMAEPPVREASVFVNVVLAFAGSMFGAIFVLFRFKSLTNELRALSTIKFHPWTYRASNIVALVLLMALAVSWLFALMHYYPLLDDSFSFGMRAITTSLHALVPLDSRLPLTVLPFVLLFPFAEKSRTMSMIFFWSLIGIAFITQMKMVLLFIVIFGMYYLTSRHAFSKRTPLKLAGWAALLGAICYVGMISVGIGAASAAKVTQNPLIPSLLPTTPNSSTDSGKDGQKRSDATEAVATGAAAAAAAAVSLPGGVALPTSAPRGVEQAPLAEVQMEAYPQTPCAGDAKDLRRRPVRQDTSVAKNSQSANGSEAGGSIDPGVIDGQTDSVTPGGEAHKPSASESIAMGNNVLASLSYRTFGLSVKVMRLFVCLHDHGWEPWFQGHQMFRFLPGFVPYYRLAYSEFRPQLGSSVSSAVTNAPIDAYFNGGMPAVVMAGTLAGLLWSCLLIFCEAPQFRHLAIYLRFYFLVLLAQASILSVLVTFVPLIATFLFDFTIKRISAKQQFARGVAPANKGI